MEELSQKKIVEVSNLSKRFPVRGGVLSRIKSFVKAVDCISFHIKPTETLGLVGESGSGKTTVGRCILRLLEPDEGRVVFDGKDVLRLSKQSLRELRKDMQIVYQNPFASLDPRMTVYDLIAEPMKVHDLLSPIDIDGRVVKLLQQMNLEPKDAYRYPHEFSGGQRQRIAIARVLSLDPKFIVLDEPTSALDISVQAQILKLLRTLQRDLGLTYLFISHNLAVVRTMSDRVAVMYMGKIVELADCEDIFKSPLHPYTRALMSAEPNPDPLVRRKRIVLQGDIPSLVNPPLGCSFHTRCPCAMPTCKERIPEYAEVKKGHFVSCHLNAFA